ncbi:MAG: hypothetical protein NTNFB02_36060 [Nitrospira sp.]
MFQRKITREEVKQVMIGGETIETYPTDVPYASRLVLGWSGTRPLHVVAADDTHARETIIITVYQPDVSEWEAGFKRRRRS